MTDFDFGRFDVVSFDCYGTLIDWETGIVNALHDAVPAGWPIGDEELLERYAVHEAAAEHGEYRRYREVLALALRGVAGDFGLELSDQTLRRFSESAGDWPAFPDSSDALRRLAQRFKLAVITNCDDDIFAASNERLGVTFDWIVTAQQARSYKPSPAVFEHALAAIRVPHSRMLHVAQSLYHDHVPAKRLGLTTVWIDRRRGRQGFGATPPAEAEPDLAFPSMSALASAATPAPD